MVIFHSYVSLPEGKYCDLHEERDAPERRCQAGHQLSGANQLGQCLRFAVNNSKATPGDGSKTPQNGWLNLKSMETVCPLGFQSGSPICL